MRLLIVTPVFWPESFRINDVAEELANQGHKLEVLAGHPNYPEGKYFHGYHPWSPWLERRKEITILRFPQIPRGTGSPFRLLIQYSSYALLASLRILAHMKWDWDAIFVFQTTPVTCGIPAMLASKISGAPNIIWVQDLWPDSIAAVGIRLPVLLLNFAYKLSRWIYNSFDIVIGQNEAFLPRLLSMGVARERLEYAHQWADEDGSDLGSKLPMLWDKKFTVLFAGNLGRAQGLEFVLDVAEYCRDITEIQWILMGEGPMLSWLRSEIQSRSLHGNIRLIGRRPSHEMATYYQRADVLLISLKTDPALANTVPGKLQACLRAGRPILGLVEGACAKIILTAQAGLVSTPGDLKSSRQNLITLLNLSKSERALMSNNGAKYYQANFSRSACIEKISNILNASTTHN